MKTGAVCEEKDAKQEGREPSWIWGGDKDRKPHVYRLQQDTGMGRGRYLKSGISIGIYLQNTWFLYAETVYLHPTLWKNILRNWNTFGFPLAGPASLYRCESAKPKTSISWNWILYPPPFFFPHKREIACVIMGLSLDLWQVGKTCNFPVLCLNSKAFHSAGGNEHGNWPSKFLSPTKLLEHGIRQAVVWAEKRNSSSPFIDQKLALWQNGAFQCCQQHVILHLKTKATFPPF